MKNPTWKKMAVAIVVIGIAFAGIFYFTSPSGRKAAPTFVNPAFGEYISSYTTGVISAGANLTLVFANDVVDSTQVGQESAVSLFDFTPSIAGSAVWLDPRTVSFKPETRMQSGKIYQVRFFLSKLITSLPDPLRIFEYSFQVVPQNFEVEILNIKPYRNTELEREKIEGIFQTADYAGVNDVEKTMHALQDGKNLTLTWTHAEDGKAHSFVIEDVARKNNTGKVKVVVDGDAIGIDRFYEQEVSIPALNDFSLVNTKVVQHPDQHVVLQFSDPVKASQNLDGLIRLNDLASLDFDIHDNEIWVYPPVRQNGTTTITVESGIRNVLDNKLTSSVTEKVIFEQFKPAVRFTGKGSILPSSDGLVVPFEAVNLNAVDVQIIKIYERNVLQFFQTNNLESDNELRRVGNRILQKTIPLESTGITDAGKWNRYTLDISKLINSEPGAIYQVRLSFKRAYSTFACETQAPDREAVSQFEINEEAFNDGYEGAYAFDYNQPYYYDNDYDWRQRDNPCHASYYTSSRAVAKNILASDLGLTVKRGNDGNTIGFVTDLKTASPLAGVEVSLYSFQNQLLGSAVTDADGKIIINAKVPPFAVVAKNRSQRGYLRLVNGEALALSNFDVSGDVIEKGIKGFLYGERGVWRPGDSLFLTFILEDKRNLLPENHPVVFELSNPQGQVISRIVRAASENGFYDFATATHPDAPTGNWRAQVKVGGTEFFQTLKIETVKPNRLKINLDFGIEKFTSPEVSGQLDVKWLHGAPGRNLKATFDVVLSRRPTSFEQFPDYHFEDPSREFQSESQIFFEGFTDGEGHAQVKGTLESSGMPSGFLTAVFRGKVFEESGNFSIDHFRIPYYPYSSFIGMRLPQGERDSGILYTDTTNTVDFVTVDAEGKGVSRQHIEVTMHKLNWRWWWDNTDESLANFVEGSSSRLVKVAKISTTQGKGSWTFNVSAAEYGRYFVRACDPVSGHCTGKVIYVDEPGWYSRARGSNARGGATILNFSTDKTQYAIGEKIQLTIPGNNQGRALVSVENGSKVLQTYWVKTAQGETRFAIDAVPEMAPNVFVHVSLLQPHDQTANDLPMRLYGVTALKVEDPQTHLHPVLSMPEVLAPGEAVVMKVSEKSGRKMTYTVAVVDEGLLDLTRFNTPDAWNRFYAREALGVRTWDVYDDVMGAFGTNFERLISIGGDAETTPGDVDPRANRFKPVVKFFGPYTLDGGADELTFVMPQYIGSVKTMLVAGYEGAYGRTEQVSAVRKPLMVLATLPRVLGPQEKVKLPVTLFAAEKAIRNIQVDLQVKGPVSISGRKRKSITMNENGEMTVDFDLEVQGETGTASVEVTATSGDFRATDIIEIEVRNPNLPVTQVEEYLLESGKKWSAGIVPFGIEGSNTAIMEISSLPPINLDSRMRYLLQYPHGCLEQTISAVFPQLYLAQVKILSETEKEVIQRNVNAGIQQLKSFVQPDGGFGSWPGIAESSDTWSTSYAGHFLIAAESKGYYVPAELMKRWKTFQRKKALEWRRNELYFNADLMQAYRLYSLALAGSPELGAMNRLREEGKLTATAAWMLASAYASAGQVEAAKKMVEGLATTVKVYRESGYSYGSHLRDKALILETLVLLKEKLKAFEVLKEISRALGDQGHWMSTQETAMCLKAVAAFAGLEKFGDLKFKYTVGNNKTVTASTGLPLAQVQIPLRGLQKQTIEVENQSDGSLFTRLILTGTPARGAEEDAAHDLDLTIRYTDTGGATIDPSRLEQGTEFRAEVSVTHTGIRSAYENLALSQVFPSGWEINNLRLNEGEDEDPVHTSAFRYQDIRDDRVFTYFNLSPNETKTFRVLLTATYAGSYYLPAVSCEAMYDRTIYARKKGQVVEVAKPGVR